MIVRGSFCHWGIRFVIVTEKLVNIWGVFESKRLMSKLFYTNIHSQMWCSPDPVMTHVESESIEDFAKWHTEYLYLRSSKPCAQNGGRQVQILITLIQRIGHLRRAIEGPY